MATGNVPDGECHCQYRQAECGSDAQQSDPDMGKCRSQHRTATTAQHQPKGSEELRTVLFHDNSLIEG
ncbi:hypothetical protein D3C74_471240 [compost metagenome]